MCDGIEYILGGKRMMAYFGSPGAELPVRCRDGTIVFCRWGALGPQYVADDNVAGWGAKFPETGWAPLEEVRAGLWARFEPKPVRILASRFVRVNEWQVPCWFALEPGEFIQGLLAHITPHHKRVYVVTIPPPAESAESWQDWPRIVGTPMGNRTGAKKV